MYKNDQFARSALTLVLMSLIIALTISGSSTVFALTPVKLDDGLQVSDLTTAGLDRQKLTDLTNAIAGGEFNTIHSVLVANRNALIFEYYTEYGQLTPAQSRQTLRPVNSITKSITSLLFGIALQDVDRARLEQPFLDFLPASTPDFSRLNAVSLEHVLTMSAGFLWNEMDVPYTSFTNDDIVMQHSNDPLSFLLSRPLAQAPGVRWYYNSGLTMLLSQAVEKSVNTRLDKFANEVLFKPLSINTYAWATTYNSDLVNAAWGLRMKARDLLKIGMLVLNQGRWLDRQIVPEKWVERSTQRIREDLGSWGADGLYGYGYQWWHGRYTLPDKKLDVITALGAGGQRIFIVPEHDLVVSVFAANYEGDWLKPEAILQRIVAAIQPAQ